MATKKNVLNIKLDDEQEMALHRAADRVIATRGDGTRSGVMREWLIKEAKRINESAVAGPGTDATGMPYSLEAEE